jgi:hypothetical protein
LLINTFNNDIIFFTAKGAVFCFMEGKNGRIIGYDGEGYRNGQDLVRQARLDIEILELDPQIKCRVLAIARNITLGTLRASHSIENPFHTEQEAWQAGGGFGSTRDHETDRRGLSELPDFFDDNSPISKLITGRVE